MDRTFDSGRKKKFCTSSDDDVEDLSAFVTDRLQCLNKGSVEELIGDKGVNVEETLCGRVGVEDNAGYNRQSVCPNVTIDGDVDVDERWLSPGEKLNQILREELGRAKITSTPERAAWPIYTKRRTSVLSEQDEPFCKAMIFDVDSGGVTVGGVELSRRNATNTSEGVPESFVTSGGFSTLQGIAQRQVDQRFAGARMDDER